MEASYYRATSSVPAYVTLDEAKQYLGLFGDTDYDSVLNIMIQSASELVTDYMGEYALETNVEAYFSHLSKHLVLPHHFVLGVDSVTYYDTNNILQTLPEGSGWIYDRTAQDKRVVVLGGADGISRDFSNPVVVNYRAAIVDGVITDKVVKATLIIIADMFHNRESTLEGSRSRATVTMERLLGNERRYIT